MADDAGAGTPAPGRVGRGTFLARFLADPRAIGAVAPSSRYLAAKMVRGVDFVPGVRIVEFGPGTGPFTRAILAALPAGGRYLGIERDPVLVALLRERFPAADVAHDSVENLLALAGARDLLPLDHVVSGLPFASLPRAVTRAVIAASYDALRPGGTFTTFQYLHSFPLPSARSFRATMGERFGPLDSWGVELRNLPPALVLTWRRPLA